MFSSKSAEWETPKWLFSKLNNEFNFTLDPCATKENHLCDKYYTIKDDGLLQDWSGETVFVNPPYGRAIKDWVKKCYDEYVNNRITVVMLIPARTDTVWQHEYIFKEASVVCFIKGRLKFANKFVTGKIHPAPFPSQIVIFANKVKYSTLKFLEKYGKVVMLNG
ncbi:MAG TPA: adenine methyltransferase [Clostridium sp.]|nr:adenine methyltransferase [Clostridium sp.]HHU98102.1 adenine methyltransferase [Petrimonas sp.]